MSKSLKKNYILNLVNTISSMIFPLITFPYAARVILADGIGLVNFFSSIISYISIFSCLGIPLYAIRETAKVRDNQKELSKTTIEILLLHICLTVFGYVAVFIFAYYVPKIMVDIPLFIILSTSLILTTIGCEWFFQGIEDFKYITIRAIVVRVLCLIILFVLVHSKEDLFYYAICTVLGTVGNNVFNFFRLNKFISFKMINYRELKPLRHLKPTLRIFVLNLITSIYINLDTVMLGFIKDAAIVGYYTGAVRLTKTLLGIVTSLGTIMIPRLSNLLQNGLKDEFDRLSQKSFELVFSISLPLFLGLIVTAPELIRLFCGPSYEPAIRTLQIISPILLFISLSGVLGIQILYPQGKENIVIICTLIGAIVNLMLNLYLIPTYAHNGAAIASSIAEFSVTLVMIIIGHKYLPINYSIIRYRNYIIASLLMFIVTIFIKASFVLSPLLCLLLITPIGGMVYCGYLYLRKDIQFMTLIVNPIITRICKKNMII